MHKQKTISRQHMDDKIWGLNLKDFTMKCVYKCWVVNTIYKQKLTFKESIAAYV